MDLAEIVSGISDLSPAPKILPKLLKLLRDPDSTLEDIATLIKLDAALTAQVLRIANSAYYGGTNTCHSVEEAANRIGFDEVYNLVGALVANEVLGDELPIYCMESGELWADSIATGMVMQSLAPKVSIDPDTAYTVGLLHAVGRVVINRYHLEQGIEGYVEGLYEMTPEKELEVLGFSYAEVGAHLLESWQFDPTITTPIACQELPATAPSEKQCTVLLSLVKDAVALLEEGDTSAVNDFDPDPDLITQLGIDGGIIIDAVLDSQTRVEFLASTM